MLIIEMGLLFLLNGEIIMQKNKFKWQLINDSITDDDKKALD